MVASLSNAPFWRGTSSLYKVSRLCQVCVGFIFLIAGLSKVINPVDLFRHIMSYNEAGEQIAKLLVSYGQAIPKLLVLFLAPVEVAVGTALLINWRPRIILPSTAILLIVFLSLLVYGLVERMPKEAIIEDVLILALVGIASLRLVRNPTKSLYWQKWAVGTMFIVTFVVNEGLYFINRHHVIDLELQVDADLSSLQVDGLDVDLKRGEYLIVLFNTECGLCLRTVPLLNTLFEEQDLPMVGLCPNNSAQVSDFIRDFRPNYAIGRIPVSDFRKLIGTRKIPVLAHLQDGIVEHVWEDGWYEKQIELKFPKDKQR